MSTRRDNPVIYWDTCVFFAWIKQETFWSEEITKGIEQTIEQVYAKRAVLMTSVVTLTEVLQSQMTVEDKEKYQKAFGHPQLQLMDADRRIAAKAAFIREFYDTRVIEAGIVKSGSIMSLGDALHLATAIHYGVDEFQTLDGGGRRKRRIDLLKLNGSVAGSRLVIVQPRYAAPLEPLVGPPGPPVGGPQQNLDFASTERPANSAPENIEEAAPDQELEKEGELLKDATPEDSEAGPSTPVASPTELRGGDDGSAEDQAGAETTEAKTEATEEEVG
jgi:predicted nucleic acid-binding protein